MAAVSEEIAIVCGDLETRAMSGHEIGAVETRAFVARLRMIARLAMVDEQELQVHRLAEAGREGRKAVDQLASDQLHSMVADPEGKVIRPDFGGRN